MVRNVTDVDDSILPKARELGVPYLELAEAELARFRSDMDALDTRPPLAEPRATESIDGMIEMVNALLDDGHAYEAHGTVYFDVSTFPSYGKVSHYSRDEMVHLARERGGNPDDPHRRDPLDFVLWQPSLPDEPSWDAPFGVGRPGWHVECSVMAMHELGPDARPPRRRHRPHLPAPRVRGRAEREHHRRAVLAALGALGDGELRGREDVEVARQPRVRERSPEDGRPARDPPRAHAATTTAPASSGTTPISTTAPRCCTGCSRPPSAPTVPTRAPTPHASAPPSTTTSTRRRARGARRPRRARCSPAASDPDCARGAARARWAARHRPRPSAHHAPRDGRKQLRSASDATGNVGAP